MSSAHEGHESHWLRNIALGTALVAGAVIISPYVLPELGIGTAGLAEKSINALHGVGYGEGIAGGINSAIALLPGIGKAIAGGGVAAALATGVVGIGGVLLGRYVESRDDGSKKIRWGRVITTAALITSSLIALPSILTGISAGIVFLCAAISGNALASSAATLLADTLGTTGTASLAASGVTGAALALSHMLTCGVSILPLCVAWLSGIRKESNLPPVIAEIYTNEPTILGKTCTASLVLKHSNTGKPLTEDELAVVHTKKIHLFVIDDGLKDYHHVHPEPTAHPGVYSFQFTSKTSNGYSGWSDITLISDQKNMRLKSQIPSNLKRNISPSISYNSKAQSGDLAFSFSAEPPLEKGISTTVSISVRDASGNPIADLEPVMGAFAHLVGFSSDGKSIIHTHPVGDEPKVASDRGGSELRFHIEPDCSGATQFYLQIKRKGQDVFIPFGQQIKQPERLSKINRGSASHTAHFSHSH